MFRRGPLVQRARVRRRPAVGATPVTPAPAAPVDDTAVDEQLVAAARAGDLEAFNRLVERHQRAVFNVCLRLLRDVALAEDATQDTFLRAWGAVGRFQGGLVRPWLLRIATNRAYDLLRARARRPTENLDLELGNLEPEWTSQATSEGPEAFAMRAELSGALERALGALPDDQRLAIILADVHGYGYEEVAAITGVAVGTVKSRISRGRGRLRDELRRAPAGRELFDRLPRLSTEGDR